MDRDPSETFNKGSEKVNPSKKLAEWCSFLGYGNPSAKLWIIGIEEGGGFDEITPDAYFEAGPLDGESNRLSITATGVPFTCGKPNEVLDGYTAVNEGTSRRRPNPVWRNSAYIAARLGQVSGLDADDDRECQDKAMTTRLFAEKSPIFLSNLFPLGKPKLAWKWPYPIERKEYEDAVLGKDRSGDSERCRIFRSILATIRPVVIFHGKSNRADARVCLGLNGAAPVETDGLQIFKEQKIILATHFSRMWWSEADVIAGHAKLMF